MWRAVSVIIRYPEKTIFVQKHASVISSVCSSHGSGPFFEATFKFFSFRVKELILQLTKLEFLRTGPVAKADFSLKEMHAQSTPQLEEMMLVYGPLPLGAEEFPVWKIFDMQGSIPSNGVNGYGL